METFHAFVLISRELAAVIGPADHGTRIFRTSGTEEEMHDWFIKICEHVGPSVSPGGVSMFARVTRPGVYKRLKAGKLTAFCFNPVEEISTLFGRKKSVKTSALIYIPVAECEAWRDELEARVKRIETAAGQVSPDDAAGLSEAGAGFTNDMDNFIRFGPKGRDCNPNGQKA